MQHAHVPPYENVAWFSSFGPVLNVTAAEAQDLRIKPDIMAPGTQLIRHATGSKLCSFYCAVCLACVGCAKQGCVCGCDCCRYAMDADSAPVRHSPCCYVLAAFGSTPSFEPWVAYAMISDTITKMTILLTHLQGIPSQPHQMGSTAAPPTHVQYTQPWVHPCQLL